MEPGRAYSALAVKSFNEDARGYSFSGLATSPVADRVSDRIDPLGARYKNPCVLLRAHDHLTPIGQCAFGRPSKAGISFDATIPKIAEPGLLKDRLDMAAGEVAQGLMRGVSIGFLPTKPPQPNELGGLDYPAVEIFELSTCAVPMHQLATIDTIKAIDGAVLRGEAQADADSLWARVGRIGLAALNEFEAGEAYQKLGPQWGAQVSTARSAQEMIKALCNHVDALERRLTDSPLEYRGIWKPDQPYPARTFITHAGSVWHTNKATTRKPGEGDWVLAVKRGVDAK
jgi:hypothetical protein